MVGGLDEKLFLKLFQKLSSGSLGVNGNSLLALRALRNKELLCVSSS